MSQPMTTNQWEESLADTAIVEGRHIVASWDVSFEDGEDGCLPAGWYAVGLDARGLAIVWPVRHEYGPFDTETEAVHFTRRAWSCDILSTLSN